MTNYAAEAAAALRAAILRVHEAEVNSLSASCNTNDGLTAWGGWAAVRWDQWRDEMLAKVGGPDLSD